MLRIGKDLRTGAQTISATSHSEALEKAQRDLPNSDPDIA
jgi:hypothetical protein